MNEREEKLYILHNLIIEGYSKTELARMLRNNELDWGQIPESTIYKLIDDARKLCKIESEDTGVLYERLLSIYKGCMKKQDYGNALKAIKELKEYTVTDNNQEITVKLIKE